MQFSGPIACLLFRRLGDSLLAIPAIRALKNAYPECETHVYAESHVVRVFQDLPCVTNIIECAEPCAVTALTRLLRKQSRPSAVLDFHSDPRSAWATYFSGAATRVGIGSSLRSLLYTHRVPKQYPGSPVYSAIHKLKLAEKLGAVNSDSRLEFVIREQERDAVERLWQKRGLKDKQVAAIFPTSRRTYKRWPHGKLAEVFRFVHNSGAAIPVLIGSVEETDELRSVAQLADAPDDKIIPCDGIGIMAAALERCSVLVGNDGGPKHLACAVNTPTVTIFRHDLWQYWTPPDDPRHIALPDYYETLPVENVTAAVKSVLKQFVK